MAKETLNGSRFEAAQSLPSVIDPQLPTRALCSGLAPIEGVHAKFDLLNGPLKFTFDDRNAPIQEFPAAASSGIKFSEPLYQQFQQEFASAVIELQLRMQRLKISALTLYLQGALKREQPEGAPYNWDDQFPERRLWREAFSLASDGREISPKQAQEFIRKLNHFLPSQYRLSANPFFAQEDAQLIDRLLSAMQWGRGITAEQKLLLEPVLMRLSRQEHSLRELQQAPLLLIQPDIGSPHELFLKDCWDVYRSQLKQLAGIVENPSWHSPTYGGSGTGQHGPGQRSEPHRSDYQRWKMPECVELDRRLHHEIFRPSEYREYAESIVFGGGMAALNAILEYIDQEQSPCYRPRKPEDPPPLVFKTDNMYFEVDDAIEDFSRRRGWLLASFSPADIQAMIEGIKKEVPAVVFTAPLTMMFGTQITPVTHLLTALCDEQWSRSVRDLFYKNNRKMYIVIDNTSLGRLAHWKEFDFMELPRFVKVISFESLVKYAQDGQELAPAGLVTAIGEYAADELKEVRKRGAMPPETTVRRLELTCFSDVIDRNLQRHSRNSLLLAEMLSSSAQHDKGLLGEIHHPFLGSAANPDTVSQEMTGGGAVFSVGFDFEQLRTYQERHGRGLASRLDDPVEGSEFKKQCERLAKAYQHLVIELAKLAEVEVNLGTSYGFHVTRIPVYERRVPGSDKLDYYDRTTYYMRVAAGLENVKDVTLIGAAMQRANQIFSEAIKRQCLFKVTDMLCSVKYHLNPAETVRERVQKGFERMWRGLTGAAR